MRGGADGLHPLRQPDLPQPLPDAGRRRRPARAHPGRGRRRERVAATRLRALGAAPGHLRGRASRGTRALASTPGLTVWRLDSPSGVLLYEADLAEEACLVQLADVPRIYEILRAGRARLSAVLE